MNDDDDEEVVRSAEGEVVHEENVWLRETREGKVFIEVMLIHVSTVGSLSPDFGVGIRI